MVVEIIKAIIIGIIEGITEWLPISSTGHMIIVDEFIQLNVSPQFLAMFLVVIQLGAIMAVIVIYFPRLNPWHSKNTVRDRSAVLTLWVKVVVASIPSAIIGVLLDQWAEEHLYNSWVVAIALIIYGIAFIVVERMHGEIKQPRHMKRQRVRSSDSTDLDKLSLSQAVGIGFFQCLAIVPGTSRSGATILGGRILGISRQAAAEFSFFMAIPVMFGWSLLKVVRTLLFGSLVVTGSEWVVLAVGVSVAFVTSLLTVRFLIGFVQKHSFRLFGYYRIALGVTVIAYFAIVRGLLG